MYRFVAAIVLVLGLASLSPAQAASERGYTVKYKNAEFEEVFLDVQDAILNRGLVIDYVGHINAMLKRTAEVSSDSTGPESPFVNAKFLQFCSSALTHELVRIKPQNLATCPYVIFVYQTVDKPERVAVGFRDPELNIPGPTRFVMEKVDKMLNDILTEIATE